VIILDTNILSGVVATRPAPIIVEWLDRQRPEDIFTTSVTYYESLMGIEKLERSRRRTTLEQAFALAMETLLKGRVLSFDLAAARASAVLSAKRRHAGRPVETRDTLIAGIAISRNATLATGNTKHFADADISLIDPWEA
jgi:predicted nucleic acid-binding protein